MSDDSNGNSGQATPPYVVFSTLLTFTDHIKESGVTPNHIDRAVLEKIGGSSRAPLLVTLRRFGWIEGDDNVPTDAYREFIAADDVKRKKIMASTLRSVYPGVFSDDVDLAAITVPQLEKKIAPDTRGETLNKCFRFFTSAAEYAGIELGKFAKKKRGGARGGGKKGGRKKGNQAGQSAESQTGDAAPELPHNMVRIPVPLTPLRTWYVEIEKEHSPSDVRRFAKIMQIVLEKDEERDEDDIPF